MAWGFAAEFLMPEDGVKDSFFKLVGEEISADKVESRHVIGLQHIFQVSMQQSKNQLLPM